MSIYTSGADYDILLEAFIGKNRKEFGLIEDELKKIISIIKRGYPAFKDRGFKEHTLDVEKLNKSDHTKTINRLFKKIFDLKDFSVAWTASGLSNAMTIPRSFMVFDKQYRKQPDGTHANKHMFVGVILHAGLVVHSGMNEKELLAIILHEIGHNFYNSIFHTLSLIPLTLFLAPVKLNPSFYLVPIITILANGSGKFSRMTFEHVKLFEETIHKIPVLKQIVTIFNDVTENFRRGGVVNIVSKVIETIRKQILASKGKILVSGFNPFQMIFRYNVEKHADSFAVDYGYGLDLASALTKLNRAPETVMGKLIDDSYILHMGADAVEISFEIFSSTLTGYPTNQNRVRTTLDRLKRAAKDKTLSPEVRAELEDQIKEYEEWYTKHYLTLSTKEGRVVSAIYNNIMEKVFGGKADLREIVHALDTRKYQ